MMRMVIVAVPDDGILFGETVMDDGNVAAAGDAAARSETASVMQSARICRDIPNRTTLPSLGRLYGASMRAPI